MEVAAWTSGLITYQILPGCHWRCEFSETASSFLPSRRGAQCTGTRVSFGGPDRLWPIVELAGSLEVVYEPD